LEIKEVVARALIERANGERLVISDQAYGQEKQLLRVVVVVYSDRTEVRVDGKYHKSLTTTKSATELADETIRKIAHEER